MSASHKTEWSVGAFLLMGFAVALVLAFASTNSGDRLGGETYAVKARFSNTGELKIGAPVKIAGVKVGEVANVALDPQTFDALVDLRADFGQAFVKSAFFGGFCTLIATYTGYHAEPTIEGTSIATTQSVVMGSLMVLFLDFILSATLY